ncbi:hypothetical protein GCM10023215_62970 [Pseudonocardia yuanmonensis]|uniref:Uncharacterized protein n=1 Tax=Pseudonocardia yuanmonensis TaxID=1095914 RepID=A0ABP8XS07_9PSEU
MPLLVAVLLKVVLKAVLLLKKRVVGRFRAASGVPGKIGAGLLLWLVLFDSEFAVLELVDLVFGDRASLSGFLSVTSLIVVLMLSRALVRRVLRVDREDDGACSTTWMAWSWMTGRPANRQACAVGQGDRVSLSGVQTVTSNTRFAPIRLPRWLTRSTAPTLTCAPGRIRTCDTRFQERFPIRPPRHLAVHSSSFLEQ